MAQFTLTGLEGSGVRPKVTVSDKGQPSLESVKPNQLVSDGSDSAIAQHILMMKQGGVPRDSGTLGIQNAKQVGGTAADTTGRSNADTVTGGDRVQDAGFQVSQSQLQYQPHPENPPKPPMNTTRKRESISDRKPGAGMPINHSGLTVFEFIDSCNANPTGLDLTRTLLKSLETSVTGCDQLYEAIQW